MAAKCVIPRSPIHVGTPVPNRKRERLILGWQGCRSLGGLILTIARTSCPRAAGFGCTTDFRWSIISDRHGTLQERRSLPVAALVTKVW